MMSRKTALKNAREMIIFSIALAIVLDTVEGGDTDLQNSERHISSPGYPNVYPNGYHHVWEIRVPQDYRIKLVFDYFDVEKCGNCSCDFLSIHDGGFPPSRLIGKWCGEGYLPVILTKTNVMYLKFKTDGSNRRNGFKAKYMAELNLEAILPSGIDTKLTEYFLNSRQRTHNTINKWGMDITRTAVALYFQDPGFFSEGAKTGEEITYEITLQLMSKLVMKKRISAKDIALFINAMTVTCINPKKFFGLNLVAELRRRVHNDNLFNPFYILVLCNAGDNMINEDFLKLQDLFDARLRPSWTGTQAMVVMALKCISRQWQININAILDEMVPKIKEKQQSNGTIENMKTTAVVIQALFATEKHLTNFNISLAIKSVLKDMQNTHLSTEEMYYISPIIKEKSLLDISSSHCESFFETDFKEVKNVIRKPPDERIEVQISVIVGDNMDFTRTWRIKISSNYSFYQALENISYSDSRLKIQYIILEGKPYISALDSYQDSIEDGLFWFVYTKPLSSNNDLVLVEKSPLDVRVNETHELILWYRSGPWHNTQDISTEAPSSDTSFTDTT